MLLTTIGFQGLSVDAFFNLLIKHDVQNLIDIRKNALSRKPGFSKNALATAAAAHHIQYTHLVALSCPKNIRDVYQQNGDWDVYTRDYLAYLATQSQELENLVNLTRNETCCLFCFEADYLHCHRRYVADAVASRLGEGLTVKHIGA
ncbi:MAG: DUF488 domain-containing protein [Anaerolineae bacterium]|nr:DUF488 domain-containing protein [Anaerolineae bacterium]